MTYLLDANILIEAHRKYYPFDFCPGFWEWVEVKHKQETVFSIDAVHKELTGSEDRVSNWAKGMNVSGFFLSTNNNETEASMKDICDWAEEKENSFQPRALDEFYGSADLVLIAHAKAHRHVVVTNEADRDTKNKVKIPKVCKAFNVTYINTFQLLRSEDARFVLDRQTRFVTT